MKYILSYFFLLVVLCFFSTNSLIAQDRFEQLEQKLLELSNIEVGYREVIDISVNGVSIQEFIRSIASSAGINITVDPTLNINIVNNFSGVKVSDILMFLTRQYNLDIVFYGTILSIKPFEIPVINKPKEVDIIKISYNTQNDLLSIELVNDTLWKVLKEITRISGKNVVVPSSINNKIVNGYIQNMPFDNVIEKFAITNSLILEKTVDNFYMLSEKGIDISNQNNSGSKKGGAKSGTNQTETSGEAIIKAYSLQNINVFSTGASINWLIKQISDSLGINYVLINKIEGEKDLNLANVSYDDFLLQLFKGTQYSFNKVDNIYIFGESENLSLINTRVIQLQHRSVDKIVEYIPDELKKGVNLKEFTELNSILVTGPTSRIDIIEKFIHDIDKLVPVILIEVMIVDYNKNHTISTGITAGMGENPNPSAQSFLPGFDYQISTQSINNLLGKFEGFGWFNLGKVTPDFYLAIKALESNGVINIRSTPKLSTLNGHEANMSSGETKYYKEEKSNYYGTQNPSLANSYTWNPINADLALTIKPFVSGDEQITLEVEVTQSEFTPREFEDSPPGSVTRKFKSLIRMKDGEMIILGGLEKERSQNIGTGVPFLSRIPIIKWFFSSKTKTEEEARLNIFIQPTIIF